MLSNQKKQKRTTENFVLRNENSQQIELVKKNSNIDRTNLYFLGDNWIDTTVYVFTFGFPTFVPIF